jgi:Ca2+-binding RTX toxin-like protein
MDNGGPTETIGLQPRSPAIDAVEEDCVDHTGNLLDSDQRGFVRAVPRGGTGIARCDIGAFEFHSGPACYGLAARIFGTDDGETLVGTNGPDVIHGLGGNDTIQGLDGDDFLCGGDGDDFLIGGNGNDRLDGELGVDTCQGGIGTNTLTNCDR